MSFFGFGKSRQRRVTQPFPEPKKPDEAEREFELLRRRRNALNILTSSFPGGGLKFGN